MKFWIIHEDYYEDLKLYDPVENSNIIHIAKSKEEANEYIENLYNRDVADNNKFNSESTLFRNTISDLITEKKRKRNGKISTIRYYSVACHNLCKDKNNNEYMKLTNVINYVYNIIEAEMKEGED